MKTIETRLLDQNYKVFVRWLPPPLDVFKVNSDGTVRGSQAAVGFILKGYQVRLVWAEGTSLPSCAVLFAKIIATGECVLWQFSNF